MILEEETPKSLRRLVMLVDALRAVRNPSTPFPEAPSLIMEIGVIGIAA